MTLTKTIEIPIKGMDCAECASHVQHAIQDVQHVQSVEVLLGAEKAIVQLENEIDLQLIRQAVSGAGYEVPVAKTEGLDESNIQDFTNNILKSFGMIFGAILFVIIAGEWLGLLEAVTEWVPWWLGLLIVILTGYPVFENVIRAALKRKIISHTLMSMGVLAALIVGQWATAAVVVFFMRVGDFAESLTTERARRAVKDLSAMAPQTARVLRGEQEIEVSIADVVVGDIVVVRPGEAVPVDGQVVDGHATVIQSAITGESMPVEAGPGTKVYAASLAQLGSLRVQTEQVGAETTFGRVIKLVEQAEANRADIESIADKFATWYLPVVASIATLTFLIGRDPLATAAVLVVACSCAFALATPIAMLATVGASAKKGLLIKGGKYLETLAKADVLLIDKTGTLTMGQPSIVDIIPARGFSVDDVLSIAASAERYSEHPLAQAVRDVARGRKVQLEHPESFESIPGQGLRANLSGTQVLVGNAKLIPTGVDLPEVQALQAAGKTLIYVQQGESLVGALTAADTLRPEIPAAMLALQQMGLSNIELLTGDHQNTAAALAEELGIAFQAEMLPEDKINIVKQYQAGGHIVVMVGDGVNDAPALAQADVGIAMGAGGTDVAIEAAHIALMREDWALIPEVFLMAQKTMKIIRFNLGFTTVYNLVGLSLAAFGFLPPILAAAAQSLPDLGILANSSRLLRE